MFINILNQYICKCAEFTLNPFVFHSDSKWQSFVNNVNQIFQYYELTNTEEYRSFQFAIQNNQHSGLLDETPAKRVLRILIDLKNYKNSVPKFFDRVFISHSSKDKDIVIGKLIFDKLFQPLHLVFI